MGESFGMIPLEHFSQEEEQEEEEVNNQYQYQCRICLENGNREEFIAPCKCKV